MCFSDKSLRTKTPPTVAHCGIPQGTEQQSGVKTQYLPTYQWAATALLLRMAEHKTVVQSQKMVTFHYSSV